MRWCLPVLLTAACFGGCGSAAVEPPQDAPTDTTAVPVIRFEDYFSELAIEDAGTGQRGLYSEESGYRFSRKARLQLAYVARRPTVLSIGVVKRATGELAGVWSKLVEPDAGVVSLGLFPRDLYVLQAYVSGVRIAQIPFASE